MSQIFKVIVFSLKPHALVPGHWTTSVHSVFCHYEVLSYTVHVLNFVGKIFVFLVGNKIRGVLNFVAMAAW